MDEKKRAQYNDNNDEHEKYWFNLEKNYVHNVYENITNYYDNFYKDVNLNAKENELETTNSSPTRADTHTSSNSFKTLYNAWPKVKKFINKLEPNSLLADIGCGEGKYLNLNNKIYSIGCDRSNALCDFALKNNQSNQLLVCDNLSLPFRSNLFDAVISIGVIHHFSTPIRRKKAIQELCRILNPGGKLMIYVWALEQKNRKFNSQDILVPLINSSKSILSNSACNSLKRDLNNNHSEPNVSRLEEQNLKFNSLKKQSKVDQSHIPFRTNSLENKINDSEVNLVDNFKSFFARKFKSNTTNDTETTNSNRNPFSSHEISKSFDSNTLERYRKILDEHRNVLPKNFTIRQFPHSSCSDTFETVELEKNLIDCLNESNSTIHASKTNLTVPDTNDISTNSNDLDTNNMNKRFYHVFKAHELDNLVTDSCSDLIIYDSYYDHGNWCICAIKK